MLGRTKIMEYKNDLIERRPDRPEKPCGCDGCERETKVHTNVKFPVEFEPTAKVGEVEVECCGDPEVKCECTHDGTIRVVIAQNLFIKVPVCYDVKVRTGKSHVDCRECGK